MEQAHLNLKESIFSSINAIIDSPKIKSALDFEKIKITNYSYKDGKLDLEISDKILLKILSQKILDFKNNLELNHKWVIREIKLNDVPIEFKLLNSLDESFYDSSKRGTTLSIDTNNFVSRSEQSGTYEVFNEDLLTDLKQNYQIIFSNATDMKAITLNFEIVRLLKLNKLSPSRHFKLKKYKDELDLKRQEVENLFQKGYQPNNKNFQKIIDSLMNY